MRAPRTRGADAVLTWLRRRRARRTRALVDEALACRERGDLDGAERLLREATARDPRHAEAHVLHGTMAAARGDAAAALAAMERAVAIRPDRTDYRHALARTRLGIGRRREAIATLERAIANDAEHVPSLSLLANLHLGAGRPMLARPLHERALAIAPADPDCHCNLARTLSALGEVGPARALFERAVALAPSSAAVHNDFGNMLVAAGDAAQAAAAYRRALAIAPHLARTWRHLAESGAPGAAQEVVAGAEPLLAEPRTSEEDRVDLAFALARAHADMGEHERGFERCLEANRRQRARIDYDIHAEERVLAAVANAFPATRFAEAGACGPGDPTPIFIVGMPRSGTSLLEQILASHPRVAAAGERTDLAHIVGESCAEVGEPFPAGTLAWDAEDIEEIGARYLERLRAWAPEAERITDKMPSNFCFVGVVALALPGAAIVHCVRDPADTCLSCFERLFSGDQLFAYDLEELARYHNAYRRLMAHWHRVLPGRVLDVRYEAMVRDQETETRRLLAHCGLEWDESCLDFHSTRRPVHTASAAQIRRPVYRTSIGRWRRHASRLSPMLEVLDRDPPARGHE